MLLQTYQCGDWYKSHMLQATHFTLHSCACNCLLSRYVGRGGGGVGCKLWRGKWRERKWRENRGWVYISLQTTTTSTTGTDETQSLVPTYDPHDEEEFFNTSFICMCLIRSPLDPAGLMASGVSSLKAHSCCQTWHWLASMVTFGFWTKLFGGGGFLWCMLYRREKPTKPPPHLFFVYLWADYYSTNCWNK